LLGAQAVGGDRLPEVFVLLTGDEADPLQVGEMLFRLREVVDHQIGLADVLVRASMSGIELERPPIVLERELELPGVTIRVAEIVLDVGIARVSERGGGERPDRGFPALRLDGRFPRREIRVQLRAGRRLVGRVGRDRSRQQRERKAEQRDGRAETAHGATCSTRAASPRLAREGFGYADCPGHPTWLEPTEWLGAALARRYPLHL